MSPGLGRIRSASDKDGYPLTASELNVGNLSKKGSKLPSATDAREYVHHTDHCNCWVVPTEVPRISADR